MKCSWKMEADPGHVAQPVGVEDLLEGGAQHSAQPVDVFEHRFPFQDVQDGHSGRQGDRVSGEGPGVEDVGAAGVGRGAQNPLHDVGSATHHRQRQASSDGLPDAGQIRRHPQVSGGAGGPQPEARHHLVEDQHDPMSGGDVPDRPGESADRRAPPRRWRRQPVPSPPRRGRMEFSEMRATAFSTSL